MLWVLIRIALALWRTTENYPFIITKYPHLFHCRYVMIYASKLVYPYTLKLVITGTSFSFRKNFLYVSNFVLKKSSS